MGAFSDINMGFTDGTGSPFEDEGAFGQTPEFEQTESLPVSGGQMAQEMDLPIPLAAKELLTIRTVKRKKPRRIVLERWWRPRK